MSQEWRLCSDYSTSPYPGETPEGSFLIKEGRVYPLDRRVGRWIKAFHPVPLLTYGSNACPGRLAEKFVVEVGGLPRLSGIVVLPAVASGVETVWACQINSRNAVPRTLAGVDGASLDCHVLLLPESLLPRMDRTEGRGGRFYIAARLPSVTVQLPNGFEWTNPITYLGVGHRGPLSAHGRLLTCREHSEHEARALIETGSGQCDEAVLPSHTAIRGDVPLSELAAPRVQLFL